MIDMTWDRKNMKIDIKYFILICIFEKFAQFFPIFYCYIQTALSIWVEIIKKSLKIKNKYFNLICIFLVFKRHVKIFMALFGFSIVDFTEIQIEISIITNTC